jgi:hypothetical protein
MERSLRFTRRSAVDDDEIIYLDEETLELGVVDVVSFEL